MGKWWKFNIYYLNLNLVFSFWLSVFNAINSNKWVNWKSEKLNTSDILSNMTEKLLSSAKFRKTLYFEAMS